MKHSADHFSSRSNSYARFRPNYPEDMFKWLLSNVKQRLAVWDAGTGTGQVAGELAAYFNCVCATDISDNQLKYAVQKSNIHYSKQPAEHTDFRENQFDLVTVAQAIHWFRFDEFYKEVNRTLKPDGMLAVIGYSLPDINPDINKLLVRFYNETLGVYWDPERKFIDSNYSSIPFPFREIKAPPFQMKFLWNMEHFAGYLDSWSAVQHYIRQNNTDPMTQFRTELLPLWKSGEQKGVSFQLFMRVGHKYEQVSIT